jgi:Lon protease-like protein
MKPQLYRIALFPLNIIVLPGEEIPLRIFEPRYKQLITECEESGMLFGIPYINSEGMTQLGSQVELKKVVGKADNGNSVIVIKGVSLFSILDFQDELPGKMYGGGFVEPLNTEYTSTNVQLAVLVKKLKLNLRDTLGTLINETSINLLDVAKALMFNSEQKYKLISIRESAMREKYLINRLLLRDFIQKQEENLQNNYHLN